MTEPSKKEFKQRDLLFLNTSEKEEYKSRRDVIKTTIKWGQRKLLITELIWIIENWNPSTHPNPVLIYVGSIPGTHISILWRMFPEFRFILFDKTKDRIQGDRSWKLEKEALDSGSIQLVDRYFTDEDAKFYAENLKDNVFLCVDMRSLEYTSYSDEQIKTLYPNATKEEINEINDKHANEVVKQDMDIQKQWVDIMKPVSSLLKFRLPWVLKGDNPNICTDYFEGKIYKQPWSGPTSSETRLCVNSPNFKLVEYNHKLYESMCFYHNATRRETHKYKVRVKGMKDFFDPNGTDYDLSYDSCYEIYTLARYLEKRDIKTDYSTEILLISKMINEILGGKTLQQSRDYNQQVGLKRGELQNISMELLSAISEDKKRELLNRRRQILEELKFKDDNKDDE